MILQMWFPIVDIFSLKDTCQQSPGIVKNPFKITGELFDLLSK